MARLETGKRKRIMNRRMFTDERKLAGHAGVFTLARGWTTASKATKTPGDESFEAFVEAVAQASYIKPETRPATAKSARAAGSRPQSLAPLR
jgi:hypothetical protein